MTGLSSLCRGSQHESSRFDILGHDGSRGNGGPVSDVDIVYHGGSRSDKSPLSDSYSARDGRARGDFCSLPDGDVMPYGYVPVDSEMVSEGTVCSN